MGFPRSSLALRSLLPTTAHSTTTKRQHSAAAQPFTSQNAHLRLCVNASRVPSNLASPDTEDWRSERPATWISPVRPPAANVCQQSAWTPTSRLRPRETKKHLHPRTLFCDPRRRRRAFPHLTCLSRSDSRLRRAGLLRLRRLAAEPRPRPFSASGLGRCCCYYFPLRPPVYSIAIRLPGAIDPPQDPPHLPKRRRPHPSTRRPPAHLKHPPFTSKFWKNHPPQQPWRARRSGLHRHSLLWRPQTLQSSRTRLLPSQSCLLPQLAATRAAIVRAGP